MRLGPHLMITEDQSAVIAFLSSPATHGGVPVERVETHASIVFLAGRRAWKLKRAVRYDYLDFSTAERRRAMCEAEVRINRRTAPELYRGVVAVTRRPDGTLQLGGDGAAVDWVIEMARFDEDQLLDRLASRGALDVALMPPLARAIAQLHRDAEPRPDQGGSEGMAWVIDGNERAFREAGDVFSRSAVESLIAATRAALDRCRAKLDDRRRRGLVRQCHGDLHLRNIVLLDGRPTLFDAIEFDDRIACIDVAYDVAFLIMDLWRRRLPRHANVVLNAYLSRTGDFDCLDLFPLFLSCRAAIRAKTSAAAAALQPPGARRAELESAARAYLEMAAGFLAPVPPCLVAIGGLSGSGKSTLAAAVAPQVGPVPGAIVLRSDVIRKELSGVDELTPLGPDAYTPEMSRRVYATLFERASCVVRNGHAAIADAVFLRPADRTAVEAVAASAAVPFVGLWLDAPEPTLVERAAARVRDASDADAAVIRSQRAADPGMITWHRIDASVGADTVTALAEAHLSRVCRVRS